jgi:hypothetical protein
MSIFIDIIAGFFTSDVSVAWKVVAILGATLMGLVAILALA